LFSSIVFNIVTRTAYLSVLVPVGLLALAGAALLTQSAGQPATC
jgi:hypothetical protein